MKKFLSVLLFLTLALLLVFSEPISVSAAKSTKLTTRDMAIAKALVKSIETNNCKYMAKYMYPGKSYKHYSEPDYVVKVIDPKFTKEYNADKYYLYVTCLCIASTPYNMDVTKVKVGVPLKNKGKVTYVANNYRYWDTGIHYYSDEYEFEYKQEGFIRNLDELTDTQRSVISEHLTGLYGEDVTRVLLEQYEKGTYSVPIDAAPSSDTDKLVASAEAASSSNDGNEYVPYTGIGSSIDKAVPLGEAFTWQSFISGGYVSSSEETGVSSTGSFTFTIKSVKPLSDAIAANILSDEYFEFDTNAYYEAGYDYKMVTVCWQGKDVARDVYDPFATRDVYLAYYVPRNINVVSCSKSQHTTLADHDFAGAFEDVIEQSDFGGYTLPVNTVSSFSVEGLYIIKSPKNAGPLYLDLTDFWAVPNIDHAFFSLQ